MAAFRVQKVFYLPRQDALVLAGVAESGRVRRGGAIDLPRELKGPGWVPIMDVQKVPFQDGVDRLCVVIDYEVLTGAQLLEFDDLEGLSLDVR